MNGKDHFFQPRDANYMKYRDLATHHVPVYVYPGFVYESVLHYAPFEQYGGMLIDAKNAVEKYVKHKINHVISLSIICLMTALVGTTTKTRPLLMIL
jgi:hypothetical protein